MNKKLIFIMLLFVNTSVYAAITLPTKNSSPLPSIETTQNIDTVLSEKVQAKIRAVPILKNQAVTAATKKQIVTLEGSVESKEQENAAIRAAKSVKGVNGVKSQLTIKFLPSKKGR